MNIVQINPERVKERNAYLGVPFKIAQTYPQMTLPPKSFTAIDFSSTHPFHEHSEAAFFIAEKNGTAIGRIAVLNNRNFNSFHNSKTAFFAHFDCENDQDTAKALFNAADRWAKDHGLNHTLGPVGFLQTDPRGIMVRGHGKTTSLSLPCHPPYYIDLLENCGFTKHSDYLSGEITDDFRINKRTARLVDRVQSKTDLKLRRSTTRRHLFELAPQLFEIYEKSGADAPMYYPMTPTETEYIKNQFSKIANPRLIHLLEQGDGTICGIMMSVPNYVEVFQKHKSRIPRVVAALKQKHRPQTINLTTFYLKPEFQGRGLNLLLYSAFQHEALKLGCKKALFGPIREGNSGQLSVLDKVGTSQTICHRIYQRKIP